MVFNIFACQSQNLMPEKPEHVLKIERAFKIAISEFSGNQETRQPGPYYILDNSHSVITLSLENCQIKSLKDLPILPKLEKLLLGNNQIKNIAILSKFNTLQAIDLSNNLVDDLTPLRKLKHLRELDIQDNQIRDLSPLYGHLKQEILQVVPVKNNPLVYPPKSNSATVEIILGWFANNTDLANKIIAKCKANKNKHLDLGNCGLTDLSMVPKLFECTHVEELILSNEWGEYTSNGWERQTSANNRLPNNLFHIPSELARLHRLKKLICGGNWKNIHQKKNSEQWRLDDFRVFTGLKNLTFLNLSNNRFRNITGLAKLQRLETLYLNNNEIMRLEINTPMLHLEKINLSNNQLKETAFINALPNADTIDLHSNLIADLRPLLPALTRLEIRKAKWEPGLINIEDNPLVHPTMDIVTQGKSSVAAYFRRLDAERMVQLAPYINTDIKLILVGNSKAGKSTFAKWLVTGELDLKQRSTEHMAILDWQAPFNGKHYHVRIFDFGGQEFYHDTHHLFFTRQTAYALLWDKYTDNFDEAISSADENSTDELSTQNYPLSYWLDAIKYFTDKRSPLQGEQQINRIMQAREALVDANNNIWNEWQLHFPGYLSVDERMNQEAENTIVIQNKVDQLGAGKYKDQAGLKTQHEQIAGFCETSFLKKRGLESLKDDILELLAATPIWEKEFLYTWGALKDEIERTAARYPQELSLIDFQELCNRAIRTLPALTRVSETDIQSILFDEVDTKSFALYLNTVGVLLYFPEEPFLEDKIFINQEKLLKELRTMSGIMADKQGQFTGDDIRLALEKEVEDSELQTLLRLMSHFKMVFPLPSKPDTYIAPLYLPREPGNTVRLFFGDHRKPTYRFLFPGYIHRNVILEFFHVFGSKTYAENNEHGLYLLWREGVVIKDPMSGEILMVKFANSELGEEQPHIDIYWMGEKKNNAFLESVAAELEKITADRQVKKCVTLDGEHFVPVPVIRAAESTSDWVFKYKEKYYQLADFKKYLDNPLRLKKVFVSYSRKDHAYYEKLERHMSMLRRNGTISAWNYRELVPGERWNDKIRKELAEADVILFLVSDDFLDSAYINSVEVRDAIRRHNNGENVKLIPIIIRSCDWRNSPLGPYQTALINAEVVSLAPDIDLAYLHIVEGLKLALSAGPPDA
jgi:internalin A